jgi:hypothetical protein
MIKATIHFWYNGTPRQKQVFAETEEELLYDAFMFKVDFFGSNGSHIDIRYIDYQGQQLKWNDFAAHNHFAKGRISFEEFKAMCATANMRMAECN